MEIFIIRDGQQVGPFNEDAVQAFLTEGTARPIDMGWCKGMPEWKPLEEILKPRTEQTSPVATTSAAAAKPVEEHIPATAKQKAFLKYLGAEFGENLAKERAALAISDAMETPKLQVRIRKWHDEKLRMHADLFQDEIDFRKANRTARYLERVQTEGCDVLKDVTKAHVQVLVESLDKKHPGWESEPESALWDYLLPAIGEHFPQLVQPAHKANMKTVSAVRAGASFMRGTGAMSGGVPPARTTGTFGSMIRGVGIGMVVLGAIIFGMRYWQKSHGDGAVQAAAPAVSKKEERGSVPNTPAEPAAHEPSPKLTTDTTGSDAPPTNIAAPAPEPVPAPPATESPVPAMNAEKAPAPAIPEEKSSAPAQNPPAMPEAPAAPAATQRAAVKLTQNIGVMLSNGQVTLPAGTVLRYLATEGQNVRVSWNNNVFFVPAMATDVNEPVPTTGGPETNPATNPPMPGTPPVAPAAPLGTKPKKPSDDL